MEELSNIETKNIKSSGWIKISRRLKNHWLWSDPKKLQWWLDILITVNYEEKKVAVGRSLITCSSGQSIMSLDSWAQRWRTSKKTVSAFFSLLAKDDMISVENLRLTTRITVCNYDSYQDSVNTDAPQTPRKRAANVPQLKKEKKERIITLPFFSESFKMKWEEWKEWKREEKKGEYKTDKGEQMAVDGLFTLSGKDEEIAIAIINQSMMNGWRGLFAIKTQNKKPGMPQTDEKFKKEIFG